MRAYDVSYFCDKGHWPQANIESLYGYDRPEIVVRINETGVSFDKPSVTLHLEDEQELINFKNSVIQAYEVYQRGKGK